uniref:Uncharacterized protein n=1 Tax=Ciona savignyi TaxID=51511 RepID=H2YQQ3_CIOSA
MTTGTQVSNSSTTTPYVSHLSSTDILTTTHAVKTNKVPNPQYGVYIVVIFLAAAGLIVIVWLVCVIYKRNRRHNYHDPGRGLRGSTDRSGNPQEFDNPINLSSSAYNSAVI